MMTCGTENKILAVSEPSKCEYLYKMETPAVCHDLSDDAKNDSNSNNPQEVGYPGEKKHDEL
jgi:hypothetical protein